MMEIKFRAWDKVQKEFITEGDIWIYSNGKAWCGDYDNSPYIPLDSDCVQQYTGLKDKNGKEIFEGDIVYQEFNDPRPIEHGGFIGVVKMLEGCWVIDNQVNHAEQLWSEVNENEVLGTIYENPELLEEKE